METPPNIKHCIYEALGLECSDNYGCMAASEKSRRAIIAYTETRARGEQPRIIPEAMFRIVESGAACRKARARIEECFPDLIHKLGLREMEEHRKMAAI